MKFSSEPLTVFRSGRPRAAGFTMVELMVTLLLASILLAVGVPMFQDSIARSHLTEQSNDLVTAITLGRSQAITTNQSITFCRADSVAANTCSGTAGDWEFWIVRDAAGTVIRRGDVPTYNGAIEVESTLTNDSVTFASDGLARMGGVLVAGQGITVCSDHSATSNRRVVTLGAGSRVSTTTASGAC
jgi:type IV fimbrial biogenesis protein FimT